MIDRDTPFLLPPSSDHGDRADEQRGNGAAATQPTTVSSATDKTEGRGDHSSSSSSSDDVKGLIPLCVQHASGPRLSTAVYGYDIAQMERKPWREPGAKLTDYFNYGFNETSWRAYCALQRDGEASLLARAEEVLRKLEHAANAGPHRAAMGGSAMNRPLTRGAAMHDGAHAPPPPHARAYHANAAAHEPYASQASGAYKTRMCQLHLDGRCVRGANCNYAHSVAELRTLQPTSSTAGAGGAARGGYAAAAAAEPPAPALPFGGPPSGPLLPPPQAFGGGGEGGGRGGDGYYAGALAAAPPPPHMSRYAPMPYPQRDTLPLQPPPPPSPDYYAMPPPPPPHSQPMQAMHGASMLPPPPHMNAAGEAGGGPGGSAHMYRDGPAPHMPPPPPHAHMHTDPPPPNPYSRHAY